MGWITDCKDVVEKAKYYDADSYSLAVAKYRGNAELRFTFFKTEKEVLGTKITLPNLEKAKEFIDGKIPNEPEIKIPETCKPMRDYSKKLNSMIEKWERKKSYQDTITQERNKGTGQNKNSMGSFF